MQRRCVVRLTRALMVGMLAVLVSVAAAVVTPAAAQAGEPIALVSITLTSITPALPKRDGTITLTGQVTNVSQRRVYRPRAFIWRSQEPVAGRAGLDEALTSAADVPLGARLIPKTNVDLFAQDLYRPGFPFFEPGETAPFTLTARVADLALSPVDGIYLMGVHVLEDNAIPAIGRARIFVPVLDHDPKSSVRMTSVVLLSSRPSLVRPGVLSDDHLAAEVGPGGRLRALLDAARATDVSFAVDPLLIDELTTMRTGYSLLTDPGGTGQAAATRWLTDFDRLRADHDGYRVLYGSPDIAALVHNKQLATMTAAAAAGASVETTRSLPLLVLPANGAADKATVDAAEDLDPAAIVLADTSATSAAPLLAGPGKAPIVNFTSTAFGGGPGPDPQDTPVHLQQRMLADTWLQASTAAKDSTLGRVRLVTDANQAQGDDAGVNAPWVQRSTLAELLRWTPTTWDQDFRYPDADRAAELGSNQLGRLERFNQSQRTYADLLVDSADARARADAAAAGAASSFWRQRSNAQRNWLTPQQAELDANLQNMVQISSTPRVSTVAREGVEFPITIRNTLPASASDPDANAVKVRLEFTSDNTRRLTITPIDVPLLRAGENSTENAQVSAKANGTVPVTAQLMTESGLKIGRPVTIEVTVTQNGTTGWVIAVVAGVVLAGSTALRIRQVNRERVRSQSTDRQPTEPPPADALSSAPPTDVGSGQSSADVDHVDV